MTEIGKMIKDEGKTEGKAEGKSELLIRQLTKRFGKLPKDYVSKIKELPEKSIDIIATDIFDFKSVEDIGKYL